MANTAILTIKILADAAKAQTGMAKTATSAQKMGAGIRSAAIPAAAALAAFGMMGEAASDLAETQSKVGQIFGSSGDEIERWSATANTALGQSQQQALDAAATFATFGKSAGLTGGELVGFSTQMTQLASDMASFSNTTPEDAILAIGSALRGEAEPIRKYGVLLDDATLKAQALKLGIITTTKTALTPQQKVLAAQAAIMQQTSDAQGDFARTSGGMANQQRILNAQMADTQAKLGQAVLPAMQAAIPVLSKVAEFLAKNADVAGPLIIILAALAVAIWAVNAAMFANPVTWIVIGIAALIAVLVIAYQKSETFRKIVQTAFKVIAAELSFLWNKIFKPIFSFLLKYLALVWTFALKAATIVIAAFGKLKTGVTAAWNWIKANVFTPWAAVFRKAQDIAQQLGDKVSRIWSSIKDGISSAWSTIKGIFDSLIDKIQTVIDWFGKLKIPDAFTGVLGAITGNAAAAPAAVTIAPAPTLAPYGRAGTGGTTGTGGSAAVARDTITPDSQVIVQVADRKLVDLIDVRIRASATGAARSLRRRSVVIV